MEKFVLNCRKEIICFLVFSLIIGITVSYLPATFRVIAQESDDVDVTARVQAWINFEIGSLNLTLTPDLVDSAGDTFVGATSTSLIVGTNNSNGWNIQIGGINAGLLQDGGTHLIQTVTGSATLVAGTNGYGVAIEDLNNLNALTIPVNYQNAANFAGEVPTTSTPVQVVSYDDPHVNTTVANFHVRAAAAATTPSGDYKDTITLTATAPL